MNALLNSIGNSLHWTLARFGPLSLLDIIVVTAVFFWVLLLIQGTRADQVFRGVIILLVIAYILSAGLNLTLLTWLLQRSVPALIIAIPVIFQPELRRAFEQLGRTSRIVAHPLSTLSPPRTGTGHAIGAIVDACEALSRERIGALIAVERRTGLQEYARTGVRLSSLVSDELLIYIFRPYSPLHDGAVIIRGDNIIAAGCVLPLSDNFPSDTSFGTRHRAALGLSEVTDALTVVVSEETGAISLASNGRLITGMNGERLRRVLSGFYLPQERVETSEVETSKPRTDGRQTTGDGRQSKAGGTTGDGRQKAGGTTTQGHGADVERRQATGDRRK